MKKSVRCSAFLICLLGSCFTLSKLSGQVSACNGPTFTFDQRTTVTPSGNGIVSSNLNSGLFTITADDFTTEASFVMLSGRFVGFNASGSDNPDFFEMVLYSNDSGVPGDTIQLERFDASTIDPEDPNGFTLTWTNAPAAQPAGTYWVSVAAVFNNANNNRWNWSLTPTVGGDLGSEFHLKDFGNFGLASDWTPASTLGLAVADRNTVFEFELCPADLPSDTPEELPLMSWPMLLLFILSIAILGLFTLNKV